MSSAPHTGRMKRGAVVGLAAAKLGAAQMGHRLKRVGQGAETQAQMQTEHDARQGRILFAALNQLKGTALKAAQLLSTELDLLPEALRAELSRAQHQATPLNRAMVIKLMRAEFGCGPEQMFAHFEPQAFAAASLGQVHAARLADGQEVAVKLQYPGMAASVRSDIQLLSTVLAGLGHSGLPLPRQELVQQALASIELTLLQELDYRFEAQQLDWFAQHLHGADLPCGTPHSLVLPRVVHSHSTARVLTMQRLPGQHLHDWLATQPSQTQRDQAGQLLWDSVMHCAFKLHRLQADPHPGNYLFISPGATASATAPHPPAPVQLGLLDFGCTRELDPYFTTGLQAAWRAAVQGDQDALLAAYGHLKLCGPDLSEDTFRTDVLPCVWPLLRWQMLPMMTPQFDFTQLPARPVPPPELQRRALARLAQVPEDLPFIDRSYMGMLHMLRALGARVQTGWPEAA